jgi:hypothetical protein
MNKIYKEALEYMEKSDIELQCPDFRHTVEVLHGDYSHFMFQNALIEIKRFGKARLLLVWTEHCGCHVFFVDDLKWYRQYRPI